MANELTKSLEESLNTLCPYRKYTISEKYCHKAWFNLDIQNAMKQRHDLYKLAILSKSEESWNEYRTMRNNVVTMIRQAKNTYYQNLVENRKNQPKELWKKLKRLLPGNTDQPSEVSFEGTTYEDPTKISEKFNIYFIDSIKNIVDILKCKPAVVLNNNHEISEMNTFKLIDMRDLKSALAIMKNTGGGESGITTSILKDSAEVIADRFIDLINCSLTYGKFPEEWKTSVIIPLQKVSKTKKCEEFRPINTVPVYEKLLEIVVKEQITLHCNVNNLIASEQSGFRNDHSCETAIISICDKWFSEIENKNIVVAVFLDLKRAFETIDRQILIEKLQYQYNITGTVLEWFKSYLSNRKQKVKYGDILSDDILVEYGVPQGTVLGPLLFNLYVNDIVKHVKYCNISMFADDTMLYKSGKNIENIITEINEDLMSIYHYLCSNSLSVNVNKSKYIIFQNRYSQSEINNIGMTVQINKIVLERVNEIKYLGVIFDHKLSFHSHIQYVLNKMSQKVYLLSRIGKNLNIYTRRLLYTTIVSPHLNYCSSVLFMLPAYKVHEIQIVQNRAMRNILCCSRYTPINLMLKILKFLSVKQTLIFNTLITVFKIRIKKTPRYLHDKINYVKERQRYNLRNCEDFDLQLCKFNPKCNSLYHQGLMLFNQLPIDIKACNDLSNFKRMLRVYIIDNY
jgi:hypothetical protein